MHTARPHSKRTKDPAANIASLTRPRRWPGTNPQGDVTTSEPARLCYHDPNTLNGRTAPAHDTSFLKREENGILCASIPVPFGIAHPAGSGSARRYCTH
jgi:hypothetical protein